jgi:uncharacterized repeat protein (TIGR02543 family)
MTKKTILLTSIVVVICILALVFGLVFGIKCTVTLEHFYLVPEDVATNHDKPSLNAYFDAKAWGKTYCYEKVTRCSHYNPYTPSRDGYVFGGWYQDAAFTVPFIPGTAVSHDITLYAKWIIEQ